MNNDVKNSSGPESLKIDVLIAVAEKGGVENVIKMMIQTLESESIHFRVVQMVWEGCRWLDESVEFIPLLEGRAGHNLQEFMDAYEALLQSTEKKPDIMLAAGWPYLCTAAAAVNASLGTGAVVVSWIHSDVRWYERAGYGGWQQLAAADVHLAINQSIARQLQEHFPGADVFRVYNPVDFPDTKMFYGLDLKRRDLSYALLYVGRVSAEKNLRLVFDALCTEKKWSLHIVGDGEAEKDKLLQVSEAAGISDRICWHGWKENPWGYIEQEFFDKESSAWRLDALIQPSVYEGGPLTAVEAWCRGMPVISTPVGFVPEQIREGKNGFLFKNGDRDSLCAVLQKIEEQGYAASDISECMKAAAPFEKNLAFEAMKQKLMSLKGLGRKTMIRVSAEAVQRGLEEQEGMFRQFLGLLKEKDGNELVAQRFQEKVMELGETLEGEYQLADSRLIHVLENICEMVYQSSLPGTEDKNQIYGEISRLIDGMVPALYQSVKIADRKLSVVAIIKNEAAYLLEWLEFHRMMGVDHFYIYDNDSTDHTKELLQPYVDQGTVTYIEWPGEAGQRPAYNDAVRKYRHETTYMAILDADEYLFPVDGQRRLADVIDDIFEEYPHGGGIAVNWRVYGTSGHQKKPEGLLLENYTYRQDGMGRANLSSSFNYQDNAHVKTICNPRMVERVVDPHTCYYVPGKFQITENGTVFSGPYFKEGTCQKLRINHYYMKSKEEFYERRRRMDALGGKAWTEEKIDQVFQEMEGWSNAVHDPVLERYLDGLRERIRKCR